MTDPAQPSIPLPTTDTTASAIDQTVGTVIQDALVPTEAAIIAAEPFMATPVLMQIWEGILKFIFVTLGNVLGKVAGYITIDIQRYTALLNSAQALAALRAAQLSGSQNAITQANTNADAAIAGAVHYVGQLNS